MRYPKEHKAETHARIVRHASLQLRAKGTQGVGVADLMKEAGLTHGGFYAHFASRDDLVVEAIAHALDNTNASWSQLVEGKPLEERLAVLVDNYLTPQHRDNAGRGCVIPALGADVAREGGKSRRMFADKIEEMIEVFAAEAAKGSAAARRRTIGTLVTLVGTLLLARATGQGALSREVLEAGRAAALAGIGGGGAGPSPRRRRSQHAETKPRTQPVAAQRRSNRGSAARS